MGLLDIDSLETLDYQASKKYQRKLRSAGIIQLLTLLKRIQDEKKSFKKYPKFGFEIEGHLLQKTTPHENQTPNYQLQLDKTYLTQTEEKTCNIVDEYGSWMIEIVPKVPFEDFLYSGNLLFYTKHIYKQIQKFIKPEHEFLCYAQPPKIGTPSYPKFIAPEVPADKLAESNIYSKSPFMRDEMINKHPRFPTFTQNVRLRRGENPQVIMDIFKDKNTDMEHIPQGEKYPGKVYLDAFTFGMGLCSLQITFGVADLTEARWLYDQMHVFTPLFLALSASMPFHKGKLLDTDSRWHIISMSVDDRTARERQPGSIAKSRYSPINLYVSDDHRNLREYNDNKKTINRWARKLLKKKSKELGVKMDWRLLDHFSYLFVRENLCVFKGTVESELHMNETKLFEAIQSSNWNDVRLKPPPTMDSQVGWRVEFRSMDVQPTPELTFLFSHAIQILSRTMIVLFDTINFYMPISKVDENFKRAILRNAAVEQKFYFRTNIFDKGPAVVEELTIAEILNGKGEFIGLEKVIDQMLNKSVDALVKEFEVHQVMPNKQIKATLKFLNDLATGKLHTFATLLREFIKHHPSYKQDSILPEDLLDDVTLKILNIQKGQDPQVKDLLQPYIVE